MLFHNPAIQDFEVASSWDAVFHVPQRLRLDFGEVEPDAWHVGGPVWRQRRAIVELAKRHPSEINDRMVTTSMPVADH